MSNGVWPSSENLFVHAIGLSGSVSGALMLLLAGAIGMFRLRAARLSRFLPEIAGPGRPGASGLVAGATGMLMLVLLRLQAARRGVRRPPVSLFALCGSMVVWFVPLMPRVRTAREGPSPVEQQAILNRLSDLATPETASAANQRERVGRTVHALSVLAGLDPVAAAELQAAASFCGIGRISVPDSVLDKAIPLDQAETRLLHRAPAIGARLLAGSGSALLDRAAEMVLGHQEHWDGAGYPRALSGTEIPLSARIAAIALRFDALLFCRREGSPLPLDQAMGCLRAEAGARLDPALTALFLDMLQAPEQMRRLAIGAPADGGRTSSSSTRDDAPGAARATSVPCWSVLS